MLLFITEKQQYPPLTLIWEGGGTPCWFSLNKSKTVKAVQNSDRDISDFGISGQSLVRVNCHNSRTSDDIDMKFGPVTQLNKRNKTASKKVHNDVISENWDVIVIFPIYGQFGAIRKLDSKRIACKSYIFINITFYLTKTENRTKNI